MIRIVCTLTALILLAACGVDGEPTHPEPRPEPGITLTGSVEVGIVGGSR